MKFVLQDKNIVIIRFDKDEDVIKGLIRFSESKHITAAYFSGLGACGSVTLSYFDLEKKEYLDKTFSKDLEIVSLTGNIVKMKEQIIVHAHGVFSNREYQTIGGHVKSLIVSTTCEVHVTKLDGEMNRDYDEKTGLNLLQ